jgi:RimJ/RimL family protein N-acetyltransferase
VTPAAPIPTLTDGVATLRAPTDDDIEGSYEQCQDPESQQWTLVPVPYSRDDARTYLRHIIPGGWESNREWGFVVEARDDTGVPRFAGTISLRNMDEGRAEIAYGSHPWVRGRGVMERALRLLLEWGFAERELRTVLWLARRGNWASRRLAWRLGFVVEGTIRDWLPQRGVLVDAWVGTLRRGEPMAPSAGWLLAPRIVGDAVVLRGNVEADIPRLVGGINDPQVQRYSRTLRQLAPHDEAKARERVLVHLEEAARGESMTWTVASPDTDELLGWVALFGISPGHEAEVGYWVHPLARGRGVAGEACRLAVRHAFVDTEDGGLGLHRLKAYAATENLASCRILEQAGFARVGIERGSTQLPDGRYIDTAVYDHLSSDLPRTAVQRGGGQ